MSSTSWGAIYSNPIEEELSRLSGAIATVPALVARYPARWLAIQLLEGDEGLLEEVRHTDGAQVVVQHWNESITRLRHTHGDEIDLVLTEQRYQFVHQLVQRVVAQPAPNHTTTSDRIDQIITHRWLGVPIFLLIMYILFNMVQYVSAPFLDWVDMVIGGPISGQVTRLLTTLGAPEWVTALVVDGAIAGVGGVLVFVPGLMMLFFLLALLEESGYMARAALVMDRFMSVLGLSGKSFLPMIVGFGCNVPGIYATRTIEHRNARILTGLLVPFMSCSARLPVYVVFGLAFFPENASIVIFSLYLLGIVVAMTIGLVLSRVLFPQNDGSFVLEVPPYQLPRLQTLLSSMWSQTSHFVHKAGTTILAISIVLWFLINLPWGVETPRESFYGQVSAAIAPVFAPAGFGDWRATGALFTGVIAKEVVVSTMAQVYGGAEEDEPEHTATLVEDFETIVVGFGEAIIQAGQQLVFMVVPGGEVDLDESDAVAGSTTLSRALQEAFTPLSAIAFLVFVLLYVPCVPTVSAQLHEYGWRWASFGITLQLVLPWLLAVLIYQGGRMLGFE